MVRLDHALLFRARSVTTDANVHRVKEMIFLYEQAVRLHNEGSPGHAVYQEGSEKTLLRFINDKQVGRPSKLMEVDQKRLKKERCGHHAPITKTVSRGGQVRNQH